MSDGGTDLSTREAKGCTTREVPMTTSSSHFLVSCVGDGETRIKRGGGGGGEGGVYIMIRRKPERKTHLHCTLGKPIWQGFTKKHDVCKRKLKLNKWKSLQTPKPNQV